MDFDKFSDAAHIVFVIRILSIAILNSGGVLSQNRRVVHSAGSE